MTSQTSIPNGLPIRMPLSNAYKLSIIVAVLMAAASLMGLMFSAALYPNIEMQQSYLTNDVVNLVIGLPVLLGSIGLTRRGRLLGVLLWPGALLYVVYNYLAYTFGIPLGWLTLVSLALVGLSILAIIQLMVKIDSTAVAAQLTDRVPVKTTGLVMLVFGVFFILRVIGIIVGAFTDQIPLPISEIGLAVADVTLSVLWMMGGVLLLRRKPLGYVAGLGLLFAASALFIGLLVFFILQPLVADVPFPLVDFFAVAAMGLICFIPFGLFVRAVHGSNQS